MFICALAALDKSSKKREAEIENDKDEILKYAKGCRKKVKTEIMNFLILILFLLARLTLT